MGHVHLKINGTRPIKLISGKKGRVPFIGRVPFFRIKKNVVVLGAVSFFTDIASEMLYPIIPIFLIFSIGVVRAIIENSISNFEF